MYQNNMKILRFFRFVSNVLIFVIYFPEIVVLLMLNTNRFFQSRYGFDTSCGCAMIPSQNVFPRAALPRPQPVYRRHLLKYTIMPLAS